MDCVSSPYRPAPRKALKEMNVTKSRAKTNTTVICRFDADHIFVRDKNLVEQIMGHYSMVQLFLLQATGSEPTPLQCKIIETVMVTIMEHGLVPSAVVTRLTLHGAPESYQGAVASGLLGVGDRYAGTASACAGLLDRILQADSDQAHRVADELVAALIAAAKPVPGFGHPVHRERDGRVDRLIELLEEMQVEGRHLAALRVLESSVRRVSGKPLVTNTSAAIAAALGEANLPIGLMRGVVLIARCAGLVGHLYEETLQPVAHELWSGAQGAVPTENSSN